MQARTILVYGDSLSAAYRLQPSQGWVALLQQRLQQQDRSIAVVNASISGETSAAGLRRLPETLKRVSPELVLLELGANDGLRGLNLTQMEENLQQMVDLISASGARTLLIGVEIPSNYGERYRTLFRQKFKDLATRNRLPFLPFLLSEVSENPELMQDDRLHPNAKAQPLILEYLWPLLEKMLH